MRKRLGILLVALVLPALAVGTTIAWDPNPPGENVVKYNVAVKADAPGDYTALFSTSATTFELPAGTMPACHVYYLAVQAENSAGLTSGWSDKTNAGEYLTVDLTAPAVCPPSNPTGLSVSMTINPDGSVSVQIR